MRSFAKMIFRENKLMTVEEIQNFRNIPEPLARAHHTAGEFLGILRKLRDSIVHGGKNAPQVFVVPRGFGVHKADPAIGNLPMWKAEHQFNANVVSLRPVLADVVMNTFYTCNLFADGLVGIFQLPDDLAPNHAVFIRSIHAPALVSIQNVLKGSSGWWA